MIFAEAGSQVDSCVLTLPPSASKPSPWDRLRGPRVGTIYLPGSLLGKFSL